MVNMLVNLDQCQYSSFSRSSHQSNDTCISDHIGSGFFVSI